MLNKIYNVSLVYGNTQKTLLEMDKVDVYYGLSEEDKSALLWGFIDETRRKKTTKNSKQSI